MSTSSLTSRRNRFQQQAEKNVFRLKNSMPEKFEEVMLQNISRITEIDLAQLEQATAKPVTEKSTGLRRKSSFSFRKYSKKKNDTKLTAKSIPALTAMMEFIGRSNNITSEGIFRKTGNIIRQKDLRRRISEDLPINYEIISPHDCANVLKNFIRDLSEPLLTTRFKDVYSHVALRLTDSEKSRYTTLKTLQMVMLMLPGDNYCLLRPLLALLNRTAKTHENLMTAGTLAIIFTPHFFSTKSVSGSELQTIAATFTELVAFMIESGNNLFKIPQDIAEEIASFWKEMEIPNNLYLESVTKKNRPLRTLDDSSVLLESPAKTPKKKSTRRSLVHVIDLVASPEKRPRRSGLFSPRRPKSIEIIDYTTEDTRPLPDQTVFESLPAAMAISFPSQNQTPWKFPTSTTKDKPVAMVKPMTRSPISQFFRNVPQQFQKVMQTPRSRAPMLYDSPNLELEEKDTIGEREIMC